jgi:hypothetical protein
MGDYAGVMPVYEGALRVRPEIFTVGCMLAFGEAMLTVHFTEQRILQTGDSGAGP